MAIYYLPKSGVGFPDPQGADPDGLLAVGGDLSPRRLAAAYALGIFPWYHQGSPILWWSPDPRCVLDPSGLVVNKRLARTLRQRNYMVTLDTAFDRVIRACADICRRGEYGTWITPEMMEAYTSLHYGGLVHSVEVWNDAGELVGGLYGVALGRAFFGESMFHIADDASKAGLICLVRLLEQRGFHLMDCQQTTPHMLRFGAHEIPRCEFNMRLTQAVREETFRGPWTSWLPDPENPPRS